MKVLLVDDEYLQREGLRKTIDWERWGMQVVAAAENGEQALELVRELRPDLVITDICMPFMDGLQLTEAVKQFAPETEIVILTCYDEFEYAKRAIKLGVNDYVMKPVELEYMDNLLRDIAARQYANSQRVEQAREEKRRETITAAVYRRGDPMILQQQVLECGLENIRACCCVMIKILGYRYAQDTFSVEELDRHFQHFHRLIRKRTETLALLTEPRMEDGRILLVVGGADSAELRTRVNEVRSSLSADNDLLNEFPFLCAVADERPGIAQLRESYCQCLSIMKREFLTEKTTFAVYNSSASNGPAKPLDISADIAKFMESVRTFDHKIIQINLLAIADRIRDQNERTEVYGQMFVAAVYNDTIQLLQDLGVEATDIFNDPMGEYHKIAVSGSLQRYMDGVDKLLKTICAYVERNRGSTQNTIVERARRFIDAHYADSALSLQTVAEEVDMSPSYFSILFKQTIERSFINYLTDLRMERAKYLLCKTNYKAYEICFMVGYDNPTYFSTLFKRYTGVSPKEYRGNIT